MDTISPPNRSSQTYWILATTLLGASCYSLLRKTLGNGEPTALAMRSPYTWVPFTAATLLIATQLHDHLVPTPKQPSPRRPTKTVPPAHKTPIIHPHKSPPSAELFPSTSQPKRKKLPYQPLLNKYGQPKEGFSSYNEKFASCFQSQPNEGCYFGTCERSTGANSDTMVQVGNLGLYPANKLDLSDECWGVGKPPATYILAEAPTSDKEGARELYYQMAIEQGAHILVATANGFKTDGVTVSKSMHFLEMNETLTLSVGEKSVKIQCLCESRRPIPKKIMDQAGLKQFQKHELVIRTLKISGKNIETRQILQIIPTIPIASPWALSSWYVEQIQSYLKNIQDPVMLVNCITGRDRSAQFVILDHVSRQIQANISAYKKDQPIPNLETIPDILLHVAQRIEIQSTSGAGVDTINQTLLPNFTKKISEDPSIKIFYSHLQKSDKKTADSEFGQGRIRQAVAAAYKDYVNTLSS